MHTTPLRTTRRRPGRPLAGTLAALAVSGLALVATAAPASATDEFPAKPTAGASIGCDDGGAFITLEFGNVSGLSAAHFDVSITDQADDTFDVAAGSSGTSLRYGLVENSDVTVSITADPGFAYSKDFTVNCFDFVGGITLSCDGHQPVLTAEASAIGTYGDNLWLAVNGTTATAGDLAAGSSTSFIAEVPDEVPFTSELVSSHDGTITDLSGTPHCAPAPTTPPTTALPAPTDPPQVIGREADLPTPYVAPDVAVTELPRTGSSTLPLAAVGTTLLGLGIAARRFAARRA